jgi:hypothetical protein
VQPKQQQLQHHEPVTSSTPVLLGVQCLKLHFDPYGRTPIVRLAALFAQSHAPPARSSGPSWAHQLLPPLAAAMADGSGVLGCLQSLALTGCESCVRDLGLLIGPRQLTRLELCAELADTADLAALAVLTGLKELRVEGLSGGQAEAVQGLQLGSLSGLAKLELGNSAS